MAAPNPDANGQRIFNRQAIGAGSASEQAMGTNGTFTVPDGFKLKITDWFCNYRGEGTVRIRKGSLAGGIVFEKYFAAAGEIQGDVKTPIVISAPLGGGDVTVVITEEGSFANGMYLAGIFQSIGG